MSDKRAYVQVTSGRLEGHKVWLEKDVPLRVGQSARADLIIGHDEHLGALHFDICWNGENFDVSAHRQFPFDLNGQSISTSAQAHDGAFIVAGRTSFLFRIVPTDLRALLPPARPDAAPLTDELRLARKEAFTALQQEKPLYALLDAARDRRILPLLRSAPDEHACLFDGEKGQRLADVAPYLVELSPDSPLLEVLVYDGWGDAWGLYLLGLRPFKEIRRRLRRSLMVQDEETDKRLYFRFYDPRVMRTFWPTCTTRQRSEFVGNEISVILFEGANAEIIRGSA
jgi:hypothetical protein